MSKKCFVISPIGDDKTEIRAESDSLRRIAKNALEKYGFEVIRSDEIARSTQITNDIVQLIQESELCLIVLTGKNPNVFYEAGRRHETGKPFIQLIKKGEPIPFDVGGIRTIFYDDINSWTSAANTIEEIQKYVDEFEKSGYGSKGTGVSLSSIAASLDRIERKVGQIIGASSQNSASAFSFGKTEQIGYDVLLKPKDAFANAMLEGNINQMVALLPRLEKICSPGEFIRYAAFIAAAGHEPAAEIVIGLLTNRWEELGDPADVTSEGAIYVSITCLVAFYQITDREAEGLPRLNAFFNKVFSLPKLPDASKAQYKYDLWKLLRGMGKNEDALSAIEDAIQLSPNDPGNYQHAAMTYKELNLFQKSADMLEAYLSKGGDENEEYLILAITVYSKIERKDEAIKLLEKLRKINPRKIITLDEDIKDLLGLA